MGGSIWPESKIGYGTSFFVEFDTEASFENVESVVKNNKNEKSIIESLEILVVEDNKVNQKVIKRLLEKEGHRVKIADHGQMALDILTNYEPSLILMDMQMPVMDGVTATKEIVAKYGTKRPPIIALTANVLASDKKACFDAGMDDFLGKPLSMKKLKAAIKKWVKTDTEAQSYTVSFNRKTV